MHPVISHDREASRRGQRARRPSAPRWSADAICCSAFAARRSISPARELFEASQQSDFFTLMRAYQFAKNCDFNTERCRRYGIHALSARQVEQTYEQIVEIARKQRLFSDDAVPAPEFSPDRPRQTSSSPRGGGGPG
jgi:hypothetical protein